MRITAAVPDLLRPAANELAMVLGYSLADGKTYTELSWQDSEDNLYAVASFPVTPEFLVKAESELVRPEWDTEEVINMALAQAGQDALIIGDVEASVDKITARLGDSGVETLASMGLVLYVEPEEPEEPEDFEVMP